VIKLERTFDITGTPFPKKPRGMSSAPDEESGLKLSRVDGGSRFKKA